MNKIKVLFLAANPSGTQTLKLDDEIRQITAKIRAAEYRDSVELISRWAVRPDDLLQDLLEIKPHIVHFSGHANTSEELILLDDHGKPKPVSKEALVYLFRTLKDNVRVIVLNACSTKPEADALSEVIDCVIGMNKPIGDEAARKFSGTFYQAIGFGRSVKNSFESGLSSLLMAGIKEHDTPELMTRVGIDPATLVLVASDLDTPADIPCPFRGLEPYYENDAPLFFGREAEIDRIAETVSKYSFVAVVGLQEVVNHHLFVRD